MEKILLIDGYSIIHRAFYGIPDLTNAQGLHTNAVYGFLNILFKVLDEEKPDYLMVALDSHAPTFRHGIYAAYKGTRKPMPQELKEQIPVLRDVLQAMQIMTLAKPGLEADDILGTIGTRCADSGMAVTIVSGDRDLLQLASDRILVRIPKTVRGRTTVEDYHTEEVLEKYRIGPKQIIDLKALMGDASDNIPGVPSVGEKTATALLMEYGTLEGVYANLEDVKPPRAKKALAEHEDLARLSYTLAEICTDGELDFTLSDAKLKNFYTKEAYNWFVKLNFKGMLGRFHEAQDPAKEAEDAPETAKIIETFQEADSLLRSVKDRFGYLFDKEALYLAYENALYEIRYGGLLQTGYLAAALTDLAGQYKAYTCDLKRAMHLTRAQNLSGRDICVGAYLLNPLKANYSAADIALEYLDRECGSQAQQALTALLAGPVIDEKLSAAGMMELYETIELPLIPVLYEMEKNGICVRTDALEAYSKELDVSIRALEEKIYDAAGETFNINSPKQLGVILFEKLSLPAGKKTKSGYSTAADVLEKLAADHEIVRDILSYRQLAKLKSTYADGLSGYVREDGRIHGTFNQTITATGRLSSTDPNLQNIPVRMEMGRKIREVFVPKEGYLFSDADYSQVELRILASFSEDENLIGAYKHAKDIHRMTASQVFHVPYDEVTSRQRSNAKAVNFGIVYGISSFGLSQDLDISRKEAQAYIDDYFLAFPGIKEYLDRTVEEAKRDGYVTTAFGRIRPVPELKDSNYMRRQFGERVAMNSPIQGTAADIMKLGMIRAYRMLKEAGLRSRLVLQIHDELLVETAPDEVDAVKQILKEAMMGAADLRVPLEVEVHTGENWLEAK